MSNTKTCPHCGAPLPPDAPDGLCPKCLMGIGLAAVSPTESEDLPTTDSGEDLPATAPLPQAEGPGSTIGHYKLLQLIGEGGFGALDVTHGRGNPVTGMQVTLTPLPTTTWEMQKGESKYESRLSHA